MSGPSPEELRGLLAIAREAARIAGEIIMPIYRTTFTVELKGDQTPVTIADRNAEEGIRRFLERECPGHGVLGEEFGEMPGDGHHRWILDPIDGTKPFVRRVPLFGTLVALEYDGYPVVGVIACHAAGDTVYAARGLGAFVNEVPARVSELAKLGPDALLCTGSTRSLARTSPGALEGLVSAHAGVQTWGDCFGYLMVATGRAEAMIDPEMNYWDVAALYPIITEAGGRITTLSGEPGPGDSVVASNGRFHDELLRILTGNAKA